MVAAQLGFQVDGQQLLVGEYLRACRLEVMVEQLHTVYLASHELAAQLHGDVDARLHMGMVYERGIVALDIVAQLAGLLGHLAPHGPHLYATLAQLGSVGLHGALHELDDVGIEASAERRVAAEHDEGHALHGALLVEDGLRLGLSGEKRLEDMLQHRLIGQHVLDGYLGMVQLRRGDHLHG